MDVRQDLENQNLEKQEVPSAAEINAGDTYSHILKLEIEALEAKKNGLDPASKEAQEIAEKITSLQKHSRDIDLDEEFEATHKRLMDECQIYLIPTGSANPYAEIAVSDEEIKKVVDQLIFISGQRKYGFTRKQLTELVKHFLEKQKAEKIDDAFVDSLVKEFNAKQPDKKFTETQEANLKVLITAIAQEDIAKPVGQRKKLLDELFKKNKEAVIAQIEKKLKADLESQLWISKFYADATAIELSDASPLLKYFLRAIAYSDAKKYARKEVQQRTQDALEIATKFHAHRLTTNHYRNYVTTEVAATFTKDAGIREWLVKESEKRGDAYTLLPENELENFSHNDIQAQALFARHQFLRAVQTAKQEDHPSKVFVDEAPHNSRFATILINASDEMDEGIGFGVFNVVKKIADAIDDTWNASKSFMPKGLVEFLGKIFIGTAGFIVHLGELIQSGRDIKDLRKEYNPSKGNTRQLKTRGFTAGLTLGLAATGVALSGSLIASAIVSVAGASLTIPGIVFFPVLVPALLTGIYALALGRKSYILHRAKQEELEAENKYQAALKNRTEELSKFRETRDAQIKELEEEIENIKFRINDTNEQLLKKETELNEKRAKLDRLNDPQAYEVDYQKAIYDSAIKLEAARQGLKEARKTRLAAEREVAYSTMEVAGAGLALVGTALGIGAVVALFTTASLASFGILPLALLIAGVGIGLGAKLFQYIDNKFDNKITTSIRNFFTRSKGEEIEMKNLSRPGSGIEPAPGPSKAAAPEKQSFSMRARILRKMGWSTKNAAVQPSEVKGRVNSVVVASQENFQRSENVPVPERKSQDSQSNASSPDSGLSQSGPSRSSSYVNQDNNLDTVASNRGSGSFRPGNS